MMFLVQGIINVCRMSSKNSIHVPYFLNAKYFANDRFSYFAWSTTVLKIYELQYQLQNFFSCILSLK